MYTINISSIKFPSKKFRLIFDKVTYHIAEYENEQIAFGRYLCNVLSSFLGLSDDSRGYSKKELEYRIKIKREKGVEICDHCLSIFENRPD